jgi:phosphatidylglycerol---prolipoprotein diacylglyceryl transferase
VTGLHPWWPTAIPVHPHLLFEVLAYAVAWRLFLRERARRDPVADAMTRAVLLTVVVVGGVVGAKASFWLEDPAATLTHLRDPLWLMQGRSIVGALLGGLLSVELVKPLLGVTVATGDLYVRPLVVGLAIGRVGCFLAGVTDGTHGAPVSWGMDLGDGVPRHPTALYEIAFLAALGPALARWQAPREGDRFKGFMVAYLTWRLVIEALKTQPYPYAGLSGLQLLCVAGLAWYAVVAVRRWRR